MGTHSLTFSHEVDNTALAFTSCWYRPSRSAKGEIFKAFSGPFLCMFMTRNACGILDSQEYLQTVQSPYYPKHLILQPSHSRFLVSPLFTPTVINCPMQQWLKHFPVNNFYQHPTPNTQNLCKFQVRWNKDETFQPVFFLWGANRQVK